MISLFRFIAELFNLKSQNYRCLNCYSLKKTAASVSLLAASFCYCQKCDLQFEGQILDLHDNSPISLAVVQVLDSNQT
ncbi:MAG: hypothetical protein L7U59_04875, partial [Flavobacteriaceae bacterium]|nr:hypothetical protein [Flavobacteriaceae bacterium]